MVTSSTVIEGVVVDARGHAVAGARVSWAEAPTAMPDVALLTDSQGRYTLVAPAPGRYSLRCDSDVHGSALHVLQAEGRPLQVTLALVR